MTNESKPIKSTTLYYRAGTSDKVYRVDINPCASGYLVDFAYGRRGRTMAIGTKTPCSVSLAEAKFIFDDLVEEKEAKGYTIDEDDGDRVAKPEPIAKKAKAAATAGRGTPSRRGKPLADAAKSAMASLQKAPADGWRTIIERRQNDLWPTNSAWRFGKSEEEAERIVDCLPKNHVRLRVIREKGTNTRLAAIRQISQAAWDVLIAAANGGTSPKNEPIFSRDIPANDDFVTLEEVGGKTKIRTTKSADGLERHFDTALAGKSAPVWQDGWMKAIVRKRDKNWPGKTEVFIAENIEAADYIVCCIPGKHIRRTTIIGKNRETVRADVTSISKAALAALKKWKKPIIPPKKPRKIKPFCQYENRTAE